MRFVSSISSSVNLWTYQGFFPVAFKFYTFGSWFFHNHWVGVCYLYTFNLRFIYKRWVGVFYQNSDFSFLGQVIQYCLLGLKACLLRIASDMVCLYKVVASTSPSLISPAFHKCRRNDHTISWGMGWNLGIRNHEISLYMLRKGWWVITVWKVGRL